MKNAIVPVLADQATVDELLQAIRSLLVTDSSVCERTKRVWMCQSRRVANLAAQALKASRESLTIRQLMDCESVFAEYVARQSTSASIQTMLFGSRNRMIRQAKELGWCPNLFALENDWEPAKKAVKGVPAGLSIIKYAIENEFTMSRFSNDVLDAWGENKQRGGCSRSQVISRKSAFRGAIRRAGLEKSLPLLRTTIAPTNRIGARALHSNVRSDLATIISRMRKEAKQDRRRLPFSSAERLVTGFQDLIGYATRRHGIQCTGLEQVLTEPLVRAYIEFLYTEKRWKRESIRSHLNRLGNAMRWHTVLAGCDFTWIKACVLELPEDDGTNITPTFTGKEVLHEDLEKIPGRIRRERHQLQGGNPRREAWLAVKEFIIFFLVTHPWPIRCLIGCRIHGPKKNLFSVPDCGAQSRLLRIPPATKTIPGNSHLRIWHFYFSPADVQLGRVTDGILVQPLAERIEEYLRFRRILVAGKPDPGTLLVNSAGRAFECSEFSKLVGNTCEKYLGVRVKPSTFQKVFLFDWLTEYPGEIENIAAILWMNVASVEAVLQRSNLNPQRYSEHGRRSWVRRTRSYWR